MFRKLAALGIAGVAMLGFGGCGTNSTVLVDPPLVADPLPIDVRWDPTTPTAEMTATIEIVINNQGGLPAKAFTCRVLVVLNPCTNAFTAATNAVQGTYEIEFPDGLLSGESQLMTVEHNFQNESGQYGVYIIVDDRDDINEDIPGAYDGESNNVYQCADIVANNGDTVLTFDDTFITVNSPGGGDDNGGGVFFPFLGLIKVDD